MNKDMKMYDVNNSNKKNSIKVSVVVPVYNVENFLNKCLESILKQTMPMEDYEVLIINDGSTDNSAKIINAYVENYFNFCLIDQENSGLSAARNTGIENAKGEYIVFIDGDDFVEPTYLEELYNACVLNDADISYCGHYKYFPEKDFKFFVINTVRTKVQTKERALKSLIKDTFMRYFAWNKMFKTSLFLEHDIRFPSMYFEDIATIPKTFYYANKIASIRKPLYNYTKRKGSILGSMNVAKVNDYITAFGIIRSFLEEKNDFKNYRSAMVYEGIHRKICNYYSILRVHFLTRNSKGLYNNLKNSNKSISYFSNTEFNSSQEIPAIPFPVMSPENKNSKGFSLKQSKQTFERQNVQ